MFWLLFICTYLIPFEVCGAGVRYSICSMSCFGGVCLKQIPTDVLSVGRDLAQATSPVTLFSPLCSWFVCILVIMWLTVYKNLFNKISEQQMLSKWL